MKPNQPLPQNGTFLFNANGDMDPGEHHVNMRPGTMVAYLWANSSDGEVVQTTGVPENADDEARTLYLISSEVVGNLRGLIPT